MVSSVRALYSDIVLPFWGRAHSLPHFQAEVAWSLPSSLISLPLRAKSAADTLLVAGCCCSTTAARLCSNRWKQRASLLLKLPGRRPVLNARQHETTEPQAQKGAATSHEMPTGISQTDHACSCNNMVGMHIMTGKASHRQPSSQRTAPCTVSQHTCWAQLPLPPKRTSQKPAQGPRAGVWTGACAQSPR